MSTQSLTFKETHFDTISRNGQPWLKAADIARALGYVREDSVSRIFDRNSDEFTEGMSQTVKLTVSGEINGLQHITVRIFSLRGAHLLAMFARTTIAKEFRKWVLDVLDAITNPPTITSVQAGELHALLSERFPNGQDRPYAWGRFNNHFRLSSYKELPSAKFEEACQYIRQIPLKEEHDVKPPSLLGRRRFISYDHLGRERIQEVGEKESIMSWDDIPRLIEAPDNMLPMQLVASIPKACIGRMGRKLCLTA